MTTKTKQEIRVLIAQWRKQNDPQYKRYNSQDSRRAAEMIYSLIDDETLAEAFQEED